MKKVDIECYPLTMSVDKERIEFFILCPIKLFQIVQSQLPCSLTIKIMQPLFISLRQNIMKKLK